MFSTTVYNICFFVFNEICFLHSRLFNVLAVFLACSILFNISSLHFLKFVKIDPKYSNARLRLIYVLSSIVIFGVSLLNYRYSV